MPDGPYGRSEAQPGSGPIGSSNRGLTPVRRDSRRCQAAEPHKVWAATRVHCRPFGYETGDVARPDPRRSPRPEPAPPRPRGGSLATRTRFRVATPPWCASRRSRRGGGSQASSSVATLSWRTTRLEPGTPRSSRRRGPRGRRPEERIDVVSSKLPGFLHARDFWALPCRRACGIIGSRPLSPGKVAGGEAPFRPIPKKIRLRLSGRWSRC